MNIIEINQNISIKKDSGRKRVFLGMSGGVDSSVSAAILKEKGYEVIGIFIKVWQPDWIECTWKEDRLDAMRVASILDIPFFTLNLEKEYKREVVDYMISEYKKGKTPNPDVMCNQYVKFGGFFDWAIRNEADFVATGHYARIENNKLLTGIDKNKDQSYFLYTLKKEHLEKTIFPVGNLEKSEVRNLASKYKLPNAEKKDSQGLCFIGKIDMKEFLSHYIKPQTGDVLTQDGKKIGEHNGAFFFTIGERHGFKIIDKTSNDLPYYVIAKDVDKNTIVVSTKDNEGNTPQSVNDVILRDFNWNQDINKINKDNLKARTRYRDKLYDVTLINKDKIRFKEKQHNISSGQALVVYGGDTCLGGGIIA